MQQTFWSPNRICRRALRDTFMRHRKRRESSPTAEGPGTAEAAPAAGGRLISLCTAWWSCLSMMSYTLSPWISRSSCYIQQMNYSWAHLHTKCLLTVYWFILLLRFFKKLANRLPLQMLILRFIQYLPALPIPFFLIGPESIVPSERIQREINSIFF